MPTIRSDQMHVFEAAGLGRQVSKVIAFLKAKYADVIAGLNEDELRAKVTRGVEIARSFGLTWDNKVGAFVALMFDVSAHFYEHPIVRPFLIDPRIPGNYRLDRLQHYTVEIDWEDIERSGPKYKDV